MSHNLFTLGSELLAVTLWIGFLPLLQWCLNFFIKREVLAPFVARKISHVVVGLLVVPLIHLVHRWYLAAIPISMILAANVHANSQRINLTHQQKRLFPIIGFLLPLLLILFFWNRRPGVVILAVLAMTIGDTTAALVGRRWGRHKISWTGKSWEGATANFATSFLVMAWAGGRSLDKPVIAFVLPAAAVALLEAMLPGELDNPLSIVLLLLLLSYF